MCSQPSSQAGQWDPFSALPLEDKGSTGGLLTLFLLPTCLASSLSEAGLGGGGAIGRCLKAEKQPGSEKNSCPPACWV